MAEVKWIKIVTDIFDDEKMLLIESLPGADSLIVIWFKLLCLAGKNNNNGVFLLNDRIAYTDEMLATIFRRDVNTVRLALKTFEEFGMITVVEGVITIPNWGKHQTMDKLEQRKEYMRNYMQEYRQKQKDQIACKVYSNANSNANVSEAELDKEELDKKDNKDLEILSNTKVFDCSSLQDEPPMKYVLQEYVDKWNNTLVPYGISKSQRIPFDDKTRAPLLRKRLREYGEDSFDRLLEEIKNSDFLQGKLCSPGKRPFNLNFSWAIHPDNYKNILEGKYRNRSVRNDSQSGVASIKLRGEK